MSRDPMRIRRAIDASAKALASCRGTPAFDALYALLTSLSAEYLDDLVTIHPDQLQLKQGAVRQVQILLSVLDGDADITPVI